VGKFPGLIIPILLACSGRAAAQGNTMLLIDTAYGHGADAGTRPEASFTVAENAHSDWTSPVDYAHGTAWLRMVVREQPAQTALRLQPCLEQAAAQGGKRSCAPAQTLSDTGTYTWSAPLSQWSPATSWSERPARATIILQDAYGKPVKPGAMDWVGAPYASLYYPMQVRFSVAITPPNAAFPGWAAVLPSALLPRKGAGAGFAIRAVGKGDVEIRFAPARPIGAEARCWDAGGKLLARAAWRAGPGSVPFTLSLAPESSAGPVWVELRAGTDRWANALAVVP
jgi:hypothetical protein